MKTAPVTVAIPTFMKRAKMLQNAVSSVRAQTMAPKGGVSVAVDFDRSGADVTRSKAARAAQTEWVAFLDDDDLFLPIHIEHLYGFAVDNNADYVFSDFIIVNPVGMLLANSDMLGTQGRDFDNENPFQTTITILVKRDLLESVGWFKPFVGPHEEGNYNLGEDWQFTLDCVKAGAKIMHLHEQTWLYRHHMYNTSGLAERT